MKVLHYLDRVNRGGAETLVLDVCRNAKGVGIDITLVAGGGGDLEPEFTKLDDFQRIDRRLSIDPIQLWRLRRLIKDRGVKIVHGQQPIDALVLYLATRGTGVKCVLSLQNYFPDELNRKIGKFVIPRMDAICPVSKWMLDWYQTEEKFEIAYKSHVVYNAVDAARLESARADNSTTLRDELGFGSDVLLLGMTGHFYADQRKDQLTVCRALPAIFERFPEAHFVFIGNLYDGAEEYYAKCVDLCRESGIESKVHFLGTRSDVADILRELDLFVFSTVQEGLGIAVVEALSLGVPTIASDIPPVLEAVGDDMPEGRCAEIFRTGDAADLAEKAIALLSDPEKLKRLGEKARLQTPIRFSIEAHLVSLKGVYDKLHSDK
jgi:glycosyltransferase involved in cell wall biosynthesis